jgi:protein-S-isoprenylcysteine O-methyltransferase Ste14
MTESASTPRLQATFAIYLALVAATAVWGPREVGASAYYATGIAGFLCVALACLGRIWSSVFIAGHKDESLVTTGPYGRLRHPLYACSMLGALGLGLTSRSVLLCAVVAAYAAAVPHKWWPSARRTTLPDHLDVRPAVFWKAFLDAGSFFMLWGLVAMAAEFRMVPAY